MTRPRSAQDSTDDMVAANEALVLAALRAMQQAEEAMLARFEAERLGGLDALTQLPGRAQTLEALVHAVAQARRGSTHLAVLFLDLDKFKRVNDECGHGAGDEVLRVSALRMKQALREADFVGRYGGDEFVALLTDLAHPADAVAIAETLIVELDRPLRVGQAVVRVTPSIGIALFPGDATAAEALLAQADAAMYCAKQRGPGRYAFSHAGAARAAQAPATAAQARGHAGAQPQRSLPRGTELGVLAELVRVLYPAGALRGAGQRQRMLRQALVRGPCEPTRAARAGAGILLARLLCRDPGPCPSQVLRRIGQLAWRVAPRRKAPLRRACWSVQPDRPGAQ